MSQKRTLDLWNFRLKYGSILSTRIYYGINTHRGILENMCIHSFSFILKSVNVVKIVIDVHMDMIYTYILNEISVKKICIRMIAMFFYIFSKNV